MNENLLFSDDEGDDYLTENNLDDGHIDEAKCRHTYDELLLQRLKTSLSGVPPPPPLTIPQQKLEEILEIWKQFSEIDHANEKTAISSNTLRINCSLEKAIDSKWPEAKCCLFFDISYNLGEFSERIVDLYDKYRERYVGCETSSFVSANSPIKDYLTKKKDRRKTTGYSPGRRLSYLARRRTAFSSESLRAASNAKTFGVEKKTILVDSIKDKKNKIVQRALFHTPDEIKIKTDVKSSTSKLKSMQLRHSLWLRKRTPKKGTPRKTPHKQTPKKLTPNKRTTPRKRDTPNKVQEGVRNFQDVKMFTDAAYQTVISENGKKLRLDLAHNESATDASSDSKNDSSISELSDTQRKKLLWAVSAALKKVGVNCTHKNFREYGKRLYHICKKFWIGKVSNKTLKAGISERMLSLASEHVNNVIDEIKRARTENIELFNQDSNSCDVFFASSGNVST